MVEQSNEQRSTAPGLEGDAAQAVELRSSHVQIIAAAGSGKTEVVSQRGAALLAEELEVLKSKAL